MKKPFHTQPRALAAAALLGLGFIHLHANAQANSAVINLDGTLTGPTCILIAGPGGNATSSFTPAASQKIDLGSGTLLSATSSTGIGSTLGGTWPLKTINFALSSDGQGLAAGGGNACNFTTSGATTWDIQLAAVDPTLILTEGGITYLKNAKSGSSGGTDAVVALKGGVGAIATTALTLNSTGTYLSSGNANGSFSAKSTDVIALSAQLVNGKATGKPTAGQYLTPITLAVQYK
jgi:hypothetical protein